MEKKIITKKEYDYLKEHFNPLFTAAKSNYVRYIASDTYNRFMEIYNNLGYKDILNRSCGACLIKLCTILYNACDAYEKNKKSKKNERKTNK